MWAVIVPAAVAALVLYTLASEEIDEMADTAPTPAPAPAAFPQIWHTIAMILVFVLTAFLNKTSPVINLPAPPAPAPIVVGAAPATGEFAPLRKLFTHNLRAHAAKEFRENGLKRLGGTEGPMSDERAAKLAAALSDDMLMTGMVETGALGDGSFLQFLRDVLRWPFDHPEQFLALLKLLLPFLLAL